MRRGRTAREIDAKAPVGEEGERALETALRALARRGLTAAELAARLSARGFGEEPIATAITRLREIGYLDEAAVADAVVRAASRQHRGSRRVAQVLAGRGVAPAVAARAARESEDSDLAGARFLVVKRFPDGVGPDRRERARALRWLLTRGYPEHVARAALGIEPGEE